MTTIEIVTRTHGRIAAEAALVKGGLAVTRSMDDDAEDANDKPFLEGDWWRVTHINTGWSITGGQMLSEAEAIKWLERALAVNDWERETHQTWTARPHEEKAALLRQILEGFR